MAAGTAALLADLLEPAKSTVLPKLGEGEWARRIADAWLRPKLDASQADVEPDPALETPTL